MGAHLDWIMTPNPRRGALPWQHLLPQRGRGSGMVRSDGSALLVSCAVQAASWFDSSIGH